MTARSAAIVFSALLSCGPAAADPSREDREAVRRVISAQIAAFERGDAPAAYGFAAEPIQKLFPTPDRFMAMARSGYAATTRPRTTVFGPIEDSDGGGVEQEVLITDQDGHDWIARYSLVRDPAGAWRITGCRLVKNDRQGA